MKKYLIYLPMVFGVIMTIIGLVNHADGVAIVYCGVIPILISIWLLLKRKGVKALIVEKAEKLPLFVHRILGILCFVGVASLLLLIIMGVLELYNKIIENILISLFFAGITSLIISFDLEVGLSRTMNTVKNTKDTTEISFPVKNEISAPFVSSIYKDINPVSEYLHSLFDVDTEEGVYRDFIALDIRNGNAYYVHELVEKAKNGDKLFTRPINYGEVKRYAAKKQKENIYDDLNDSNWRGYIPENVLKAEEPHPPIKLKVSKTKSDQKYLSAFYFEFKNDNAHYITYLRETTAGYRVFHISALEGNADLNFKFDKSERMIYAVICTDSYGKRFEAYDRKLSEDEIKYIQTEANKKAVKQKGEYSAFTSCTQYWKRNKKSENTRKWELFADMLKDIAKYGTEFEEERKGWEE